MAEGLFAFHTHYPIKPSQNAIIRALRQWGLRPSLPRDTYCILQWAPHSKTSWNRVLQEEMISACYFVRSGCKLLFF